MALCIFLFCTLQSVLAADQRPARRHERQAARDPQLGEHRLRPAARLRRRASSRVPGVERVADVNWFGGSLPAKKEGRRPRRTRPRPRTGATSSRTWRSSSSPSSRCTPSTRSAPRAVPGAPRGTSAAAHREEARRQVRLEDRGHLLPRELHPAAPQGRRPLRVRRAGIFDTDPVKYPGTDTNLMVFSRKYLYEATGRTLQAGTLLRRRSPTRRRRAR